MSRLGLFVYKSETKYVGDHLDWRVAVKFEATAKLVRMTMTILVSRMYLDTVHLVLCGNSKA
jgi:hypothetical protein